MNNHTKIKNVTQARKKLTHIKLARQVRLILILKFQNVKKKTKQENKIRTIFKLSSKAKTSKCTTGKAICAKLNSVTSEKY